MKSDKKEELLEAMESDHTCNLVKLSKNRKALRNWWVFISKHEDDTLVPRYKARLAVKGFSQKSEVD